MFWYVKNRGPFRSLVSIYIQQALTTGTCLNHLTVTVGWMTYFIRQVHAGNRVS